MYIYGPCYVPSPANFKFCKVNRLLDLRPAKVQCFQASVAYYKWRTKGDVFGCARSTNPAPETFLQKYKSICILNG